MAITTGNTAAITARAESRHSTIARRAAGGTAIALGLALFAAALPQAVGGLIVVPAYNAEAALAGGSAVLTDTELETIRQARIAAFAWTGQPQDMEMAALADLSLARLHAAGGVPDPEALGRATAELKAALERAPGNSRRWALLADAVLLGDGPGQRAADLLTASMLTGPMDPGLVLFRCELGFQLYGDLGEEGRRALAHQIQTAWRLSADGLVRVSRRQGKLMLVRSALASDPAVLQQFEAKVAASTRA